MLLMLMLMTLVSKCFVRVNVETMVFCMCCCVFPVFLPVAPRAHSPLAVLLRIPAFIVALRAPLITTHSITLVELNSIQ